MRVNCGVQTAPAARYGCCSSALAFCASRGGGAPPAAAAPLAALAAPAPAPAPLAALPDSWLAPKTSNRQSITEHSAAGTPLLVWTTVYDACDLTPAPNPHRATELCKRAANDDDELERILDASALAVLATANNVVRLLTPSVRKAISRISPLYHAPPWAATVAQDRESSDTTSSRAFAIQGTATFDSVSNNTLQRYSRVLAQFLLFELRTIDTVAALVNQVIATSIASTARPALLQISTSAMLDGTAWREARVLAQLAHSVLLAVLRSQHGTGACKSFFNHHVWSNTGPAPGQARLADPARISIAATALLFSFRAATIYSLVQTSPGGDLFDAHLARVQHSNEVIYLALALNVTKRASQATAKGPAIVHFDNYLLLPAKLSSDSAPVKFGQAAAVQFVSNVLHTHVVLPLANLLGSVAGPAGPAGPAAPTSAPADRVRILANLLTQGHATTTTGARVRLNLWDASRGLGASPGHPSPVQYTILRPRVLFVDNPNAVQDFFASRMCSGKHSRAHWTRDSFQGKSLRARPTTCNGT